MWHVWGIGDVQTGFWWRNMTKRDHLEDRGRDRKIILKCVFKKWDRGGMDCIALVQQRGRWWALVNAVMNLRVP